MYILVVILLLALNLFPIHIIAKSIKRYFEDLSIDEQINSQGFYLTLAISIVESVIAALYLVETYQAAIGPAVLFLVSTFAFMLCINYIVTFFGAYFYYLYLTRFVYNSTINPH